MAVADVIKDRLNEALAPILIEVIDDSHKHAGHAGARPGGESHFSVTIISAQFEGMSRVSRQRLVYQHLDDLMKTQIHALALTTKAPSER